MNALKEKKIRYPYNPGYEKTTEKYKTVENQYGKHKENGPLILFYINSKVV